MEDRSSKIQSVRASEIQDMISHKLPESLISLILSFLSSKQMVQTCVLSTKWLNRWTSSITNLEFHNTDLSYNCIQLCSLCNHEYYTNDLALAMPCRGGSNRHIVSTEQPLILNLPLLKKFHIKDCTWPDGKDLVVQAPLLEIISIEDNGFCNHSSHAVSKQSIKFNAKHLKQFTYSGCGFTQVHLFDQNFISFDSAEIVLNKCKHALSEPNLLRFLLFLFRQIYQVKSIKLEGFNLEVLIRAMTDIPTFSMLTSLELGLTTFEVLLCLLQNSPVLKTLIIKGISYFPKELLNHMDVPHCLASSLQKLRFIEVNGDMHELFLAKYFLVKGTMMKSMVFSLGDELPNKSKTVKDFKKIVFSYPGEHVSILFLT